MGADFVGEERADRGRQLAAIGVMSSMAKLPDGYDQNALLPNPPPVQEQSVEQLFAAVSGLAKRHNAKVNQHGN